MQSKELKTPRLNHLIETSGSPKQFQFQSQVVLTATQQVLVSVKAPTACEAFQFVKAQGSKLQIDLARASVQRWMGKVTKSS